MAENSKSIFRSSARFLQRPLEVWENDVSDKEQMTMLIDIYINLQRIKTAPDRDKEIEYQIKAVKAKLEAFGIVTEDLNIR